MTFAGAMVLFLIGLVIALGTSSPIIGRIFVANPTPPEISFYNDWTMPLAILAAIMTVIGQYLFWQRYDSESLAADLTWPVVITCVITLATIMLGGVYNLYYMLYLLAAWFAVVGNTFVVYRLMKKRPRLIGGSLTHFGFGLLLLGILASSVYNENLLDRSTRNYNAAIERGEITDEEGFLVRQKVNFLELELNQPKVVNDEYLLTYEGYTLENQERPGQQQYRIKFEPADGDGRQFYMYPEVYPMMASSTAENIQWSVDPDVKTGLFSDIYLYVAGSSYVEMRNKQLSGQNPVQPVADLQDEDSTQTRTLNIARGESVTVGNYQIKFRDFGEVVDRELPDSTMVAVRAHLEVTHRASGQSETLHPLFAIYREEGQSWVYAPPVDIPDQNITIRFTRVNPESDEIELTVGGISGEIENEWVLVVAEEKPFISVVWLGTFLLMAGFSVSIFRHWDRERKKTER